MSIIGERICEEALSLSEAERAELALLLIRSLDGPQDPAAEAAWDRELERRVEEIKSGATVGIPAEQVFAELRKKYNYT